MRKRILNILFLIVVLPQMFGQQDPQYTQYMYNMSMVNPAYAGSTEAVSMGFVARTQWLGVSGAPQTFSGYYHRPLGKKIGIGGSLLHDKIGPVNETHAYADFSYTVNVTDNSLLAFGLKAGATFQQIGLLSLNQNNENDPKFSQNSNKIHPNFGFGLFFYDDNFYIGGSVPNVLKSLHFEKENGAISNASERMHGFLTSGYVFELNESFKLKPSCLLKYTSHSPLSIDISLNTLWREKVEFGVSHRLDDSWSFITNVRLTHNIRIGYAYDHTISNLGQFNSGSHEFLLLFDFYLLSNNPNRTIRFF